MLAGMTRHHQSPHHHPNYQQQHYHSQPQQQQSMMAQLPDTIPDFGAPMMMASRPPVYQNEAMGMSPQLPSAGLAAPSSGLSLLDAVASVQPPMAAPQCGGPLSSSSNAALSVGGGGPYLFHQTPSGSTLCQLGTMDPPPGPVMCSPTGSQSGSQPRLVHLSGGGANDSGLSSLSGGFVGCSTTNAAAAPHPILHQHNFSPDVRGELEELEPVPRDRCNTWPLRRAMGLDGPAQTSPLIHDRIPEEESMYEEEDAESSCAMGQQRLSGTDSSGTLAGPSQSPNSGHDDHQNPEDRPDSAVDCSSRPESPPCSSKKTSTRRNAWGNLSYADLITQAIFASPEKRLTLSQVYEWMVQNVPYFRDKGDSNSSAGWKNSIRHNLSLHSRFMRIQNEGAGKSSWWVINPDAKPGRNPRRRANTMENASKAAMDKKRRGARKKMEQMVQQKGGQPGPSGSMHVLFSDEIQEGAEMSGTESCSGGGPGAAPNFDTFRPRAQSTLSVTGPTRLSPKLEPTGFEDFDFPPWMDQSSSQTQQQPPPPPTQMNPQVNELLDRTDQMRLDGQIAQPIMNGVKMETSNAIAPPQPIGGPLLVPKTEMESVVAAVPAGPVKQEQPTQGIIPPPPSYQELSAVRRPVQMQTNPILRQMGSPQVMSPLKMNASLSGVPPPPGPAFCTVAPSLLGSANFQWNPAVSATGPMLPGSLMSAATAGGQQFIGLNNASSLPMDLENVNAMPVDQSLLTDLDMDAMLRNELAQGGQFDLP